MDAQPEGAFIYSQVFVTILLMISISASKCLKKHVAMVPGSSFTDMGKGYIRISYAYDMDVLKEGMRRLERFLKANYNIYLN